MGRPIVSEKMARMGHDEDEDGTVISFANERLIYLTGYVEENPIAQATAALFNLLRKDPRKPIKLVISTYGGSVYEMFGLYDAIKYVQSLGCEVHTVGLGKIMSAGVLLLACGTKGKRLIGENTSVMYHLGKSDAEGDIFEMRNSMKELERLEVLANELLSSNTSMSVNDIDEMLKERQDVYLTAERAIELGIADVILGKPETT